MLDKIKIGPVVYTCAFTTLDDDTCGKYSMKEGHILVDKTMPSDIQCQTVCHEKAHLMLRSLIVKNDEVSAEGLGDFMFQLIRDNKALCRWLQESSRIEGEER